MRLESFSKEKCDRTRVAPGAYRGAYLAILLCVLACSHPQRIAVMPFENYTQGASDNWLRDGLSESLTDHLFYVEKIIPVHREEINEVAENLKISPYLYLEDETQAIQFGRVLRVDKIVIGRFRREGEQLVIFQRVLDVKNRKLLDPYRLRISGPGNFRFFHHVDTLVENLLPSMEKSSHDIKRAMERMQPAGERTQELKAFEYFVLGRGAYFQSTEEDLRVATTWHREAIKVDFRYALAYAGLAESLTKWGFLRKQKGLAYQEYYRKAQENIELARKYDPLLPDFHFAWMKKYLDADLSFLIGEAQFQNKAYAEAIASYTETLRQIPTDAFAQMRIGDAQAQSGQKENARAAYEKALAINPDFTLAHQRLQDLH